MARPVVVELTVLEARVLVQAAEAAQAFDDRTARAARRRAIDKLRRALSVRWLRSSLEDR